MKDIVAKIKEPIEPEKVFFGLILDIFGPPKNLPKTKPPISDATHVKRRLNNNILSWIKLENIKKIEQKIKIYIIKKMLVIKKITFFLKILLDILLNSKKAIMLNTIKLKTKMDLNFIININKPIKAIEV